MRTVAGGGSPFAGALAVLLLLLLAAGAAPLLGQEAGAEDSPRDAAPSEEYRTLRAGEGFRTEVVGRDVLVEPRNRRSVSAWDLGFTAAMPGVPGSEIGPFAAIYLWRRPDEKSFLRAILVGLYNNIFYTRSAEGIHPLEGIFTFENYTVPTGQTETVDGFRLKREELFWGTVRAGAGIGFRRQLEHPGENDNQLAVSLLAEPGFFYADETSDTAPDFLAPEDTFEARARLILRLDKMERNLFELAHEGFALGSDIFYGWRADWEDWGLLRSENASSSRDHAVISGFLKGAGGVPFVKSERHRLIGTLHAGAGDGLDRFSGFRLGGGPSGDEFEAQSIPLIPGALIQEFTTDRYVVAVGEYRWEPIFFVYLSLRSSVSLVHRRRFREEGSTLSDDVLSSIGARISTGFFFRTQLQIDYNYNPGVLRRGEFDGHELVIHISGEF